jgi:membrane-bound lytic murein transglycosylase A
MQVPLTSFRSVATDKRFLPPGALVYVDTRLPARQRPGVGLALTQDTGSAIRGPVRADLFTGTGEQAGALAGGLKQPMRMWLLWPKGKVPPPKIPVARFFANP